MIKKSKFIDNIRFRMDEIVVVLGFVFIGLIAAWSYNWDWNKQPCDSGTFSPYYGSVIKLQYGGKRFVPCLKN